MSRKAIDLTGERFGRLVVIEMSGRNKYGHTLFLCKCDCGNLFETVGSRLTNGNTKSCGCYKIEKALEEKPYKRKYNEYDLSGDYGIGITSKGEEFYFDLEDYEKIKNYCWRIHHGYVETSVRKDRKSTTIYFHRLVLPEFDDSIFLPDHINRITYDNRKENLRIVDEPENLKNKSMYSSNKTGRTGVEQRENGKWRAAIRVNGKRISRTFDEFSDAVSQRLSWEKEFNFYAGNN